MPLCMRKEIILVRLWMPVDKNIISAWEQLCKRDEWQVRPMYRNPSVPVGSAIMPKAREESWACLVPLPLLSVTKAVWHTRTGDHVGENVALLARAPGCHWQHA